MLQRLYQLLLFFTLFVTSISASTCDKHVLIPYDGLMIVVPNCKNPIDPSVNKANFNVTPIVGDSSNVAFGVSLQEKPDSNVTIFFSSADEFVAAPMVSQITFTSENWYNQQLVQVNLLNPISNTQIDFLPSNSSDSRFNNVTLDSILITSHQLLLHQPQDRIVYSEFNMSIPIGVSYVGDYDDNLTMALGMAPSGMTLDSDSEKLFWEPSLADEGNIVSVTVDVSDGYLSESLNFELYVAQPRLLSTSTNSSQVIVTDNDSSFNGMTIESMDESDISNYRLYSLSWDEIASLYSGETLVGEALLVKGSTGNAVRVTLPLQGLVSKDELLSFHTKSYLGAGNWNRIDYDYEFSGTIDNPIYGFNTTSLYGVVSFVKKTASVLKSKKNMPKKILQKAAIPGVQCAPKTWFFGMLSDLDNQVCTFDTRPEFKLHIFNFTDADISDTVSIDEIASWVQDSQDKLDILGMPYKKYSTLTFEDIREEGLTFTENSLFKDTPELMHLTNSKIKKSLSSSKARITTYHEYFHQSQAAIENNIITSGNKDEALWLIESSAVWFSDYVDNDNGEAYRMSGIPFKLLAYGLQRIRQNTIGSAFRGYRTETYGSTPYHRGLFLEMLENHCPGFTQYIPYLFQAYANDPTGIFNFYDIVRSSQCDFGSPTGSGNESRLETALLYYQYIASMKKDENLIANFQTSAGFNFMLDNSFKIDEQDWTTVGLNAYKNLSSRAEWMYKSIDTQTKTIYIRSFSNDLPKCQERYIRIKPDNTIMVSFASSDASFPDTPTTMLGNMKQFMFGVQGKYDFTFFTDSLTGKQVFPEMYLTLADPVDMPNLAIQEIEVGIGLRRNNLISYVDDKSLCAETVPKITDTTVSASGDIPQQYRDASDSQNYIDRIKITCLESGSVFYATVGSDGMWSTSITITFNENQSRFTIEGYNALNEQQIIVTQRMTIAKY